MSLVTQRAALLALCGKMNEAQADPSKASAVAAAYNDFLLAGGAVGLDATETQLLKRMTRDTLKAALMGFIDRIEEMHADAAPGKVSTFGAAYAAYLDYRIMGTVVGLDTDEAHRLLLSIGVPIPDELAILRIDQG